MPPPPARARASPPTAPATRRAISLAVVGARGRRSREGGRVHAPSARSPGWSQPVARGTRDRGDRATSATLGRRFRRAAGACSPSVGRSTSSAAPQPCGQTVPRRGARAAAPRRTNAHAPEFRRRRSLGRGAPSEFVAQDRRRPPRQAPAPGGGGPWEDDAGAGRRSSAARHRRARRSARRRLASSPGERARRGARAARASALRSRPRGRPAERGSNRPLAGVLRGAGLDPRRPPADRRALAALRRVQVLPTRRRRLGGSVPRPPRPTAALGGAAAGRVFRC